MSGRIESHQRAIDQTAVLFPYLTLEERVEWYDRLQPCSLTELTINIPTFAEQVQWVIKEKTH